MDLWKMVDQISVGWQINCSSSGYSILVGCEPVVACVKAWFIFFLEYDTTFESICELDKHFWGRLSEMPSEDLDLGLCDSK